MLWVTTGKSNPDLLVHSQPCDLYTMVTITNSHILSSLVASSRGVQNSTYHTYTCS